MDGPQHETANIIHETAAVEIFMPPSISYDQILTGRSYAHYSPCPQGVTPTPTPTLPHKCLSPTPCVLGVDEAGRGPVLGPMVYSAFYLPLPLHYSLLAKDHQFDDSKILTPGTRSNLVRLLCTPGHPLHQFCGWAVKVMSARDLSAGMLRAGSVNYNLNAQAMDATVDLIRGVVEERGVDVKEVYIDTIGNPQTYQRKLERIFPTLKITVAKKADSLYPCVSAASVCAKVTRDAALDVCYEDMVKQWKSGQEDVTAGWGSGYPSDPKCVGWLKKDMNPLFGWGIECRFSWGTAKEMLEAKGALKVDWPADEDETDRLTDFFPVAAAGSASEGDELQRWYGQRLGEIF